MPAVALAQESVTAVRFSSLGDTTRVAVEASGAFQFTSGRLANPDRIFFDLPGTVPTLDRKGINVIPVGDSFLRQIRVAETQRGTTRVVLDLQSGAAEVSTSVLENPDRLMIELRRPGTHPVQTEPAVATAVEPARVFQPPAPTQSVDRRKTPAPELDPPTTIVGGQMATNVGRNDPLAHVPAASPAPPPPGTGIPSRPARSTPGTATVTLASIPAPTTSGQINLPAPERTTAERVGLPAKSRNARDESMIRALGLKVGRIVIDPGHGGHDTGSSGPAGLKEKDLVLDVAKRVGALVEQHLGWEVVYTRSEDRFIPLEQRTEIANNKHADLFLSIHANSSSLRTATGIETYYLNFTTSKAALDVAARENATSEKTVFDLQDLLQKIALKDKVDESREFAVRIQTSLYTMSAKTPVRTRDRGVRKAPFVVLIGASMPSVLAEVGFISNPHDEALMKRPEYRQKIAEALYKGVGAYASTLSHFQVAQSLEE
jgi:N-acetylmuramoyl-L-alanine amidase